MPKHGTTGHGVSSGKKQLAALFKDTLLFTAALLSLLALLHLFQPHFLKGSYTIAEKDIYGHFTLPLEFRSEEDSVAAVELPFRISLLSSKTVLLSADDCVESFKIDGQPIEQYGIPYCGYDREIALTFGGLSTGTHHASIVLRNFGGPGRLSMRASPNDPLRLSLLLIILLLVVSYLLRLRRDVPIFRDPLFFLPLASGVALRYLYLVATPFSVRSHDVEGHIEYIRFIADHLTLPSPTAGWEYYQPPLYYILGGLWTRLAEWFGASAPGVLVSLQVLSLLLSVATLGLGLWIAEMLFSKQERTPKLLFSFTIATFPSLVFFAARINNDVLLHFFVFLSFALLLRWWKSGGDGFWILSMLTASLALLTKTNGAALLALGFLCLLLKRKMPWKNRLFLGETGILMGGIVSGWFLFLRFVVQDQQNIVGNIGNLNGNLAVDGSLLSLVKFNLFRVLSMPFNDAWNDAFGRDNFWEYFYRSAFFGEFVHDPSLTLLASALLVVGLFACVFFLAGFFRDLKRDWRKHLPLWLGFLVIILLHIAYRQLTPFSSIQDFRYSILLLVPLAFYAVSGTNLLKKPYRTFALYLLSFLPAFSTIFLVALSVESIW